MKRRDVITGGVAAALASTATSAYAQAGDTPDLVGSYFGTVTATNPPLGSFNEVISFHTGGVVTESRRYFVPGTPLGDLLETTGHGAWRRTGSNTFEAFFRFLVQDANSGAPIATDNVRLFITRDRKSGALSGTFASQIKDLSDNVILAVTGDYAATPITV